MRFTGRDGGREERDRERMNNSCREIKGVWKCDVCFGLYFTDFVNVDCVCSIYTIFYVSLLSKYNTPIPTHAHTIFYYYHQSTSKQHPRPRGVKRQSIIVILLVTGHHRDILMPYHRGGMERIVVVGPCI